MPKLEMPHNGGPFLSWVITINMRFYGIFKVSTKHVSNMPPRLFGKFFQL